MRQNYLTYILFAIALSPFISCNNEYDYPDVSNARPVPHNLAGNGQTNARTVFLGGVEWDEDLLLGRDRNRLAIIGHLDNHVVILAHLRGYVDVLSSSLQGILDEVDKNLRNLAFIGINHQIILLRPILAGGTTTGGKLTVQSDDAIHQFPQVQRLANRLRHTGELAVGLNEANQVLGGVGDGLQPGLDIKFTMAVLIDRLGHCVREGCNRRHRIHDLVREHADELGPGILLMRLPLLFEDGSEDASEKLEVFSSKKIYQVLKKI